MQKETKDKFLRIIKATVNSEPYDGIGDITDEELREMFRLAGLHQVTHIIAYYRMKMGDERFAKHFWGSVKLTTKQVHAAESIGRALFEKQIPFIILKGYVLRRLYPENWMRNSCDVDVLVGEDDLASAGECLEALGFDREDGLSAHDVTYTQGAVHVELHYTLIEDYRVMRAASVLERVWKTSVPCPDGGLVMSDEMFYFYHVAHMAKHFENGGCGIRSVLDLWLLNNKCDFSREKRDELLLEGGLLDFERGVRKLSDYWFSDGDEEGLLTLEKYVLSGGAYGRTDNSVSVKREQAGGRFKYLLSRIFAPYSLLKRYYPVLEKHPYLLPFFEVKRWIDAMLRDGKKYRMELRENMKKDRSGETREMLASLGLINNDN